MILAFLHPYKLYPIETVRINQQPASRQNWFIKTCNLGSGCGSVGRAVAFDTRGPRFDSSHQQNFIEHLFIINCIEKMKINKKRPGMAHFLKKLHWYECILLSQELQILQRRIKKDLYETIPNCQLYFPKQGMRPRFTTTYVVFLQNRRGYPVRPDKNHKMSIKVAQK